MKVILWIIIKMPRRSEVQKLRFSYGKEKSKRDISNILNRCITAIHNVLSKKKNNRIEGRKT